MAKRSQKKKKTAPAVRVGELATKERRHQQGGVITEVVDRDAGGKVYMKRHRARLECMLDYYFKERRINEAQFMTGLKFREVYLRVNYGFHCKNLSNPYLLPRGQSGPDSKMLANIDCVRLLGEAYALLSPEQQEIVRNVCGYDEFAGGRDNKRILERALDILADKWKID